MREAEIWALEEFGRADLGDVRRRERLVAMASSARERPSGKVAAVFSSDREREAAYDFLESAHVDPSEVMDAVRKASLRRCKGEAFVFVAVDGTSLSLTDRAESRGVGSVGANASGGRGLKVVDALAIDPEGTVIGWIDLRFWARSLDRVPRPRGTFQRQTRPVEEKETQHWIDTVNTAATSLDEASVRGWFQLDREADGVDLLRTLDGTGHWWTVRGNANRNVEIEGGDIGKLRALMGMRAPTGSYELQVTARPNKRKGRTAKMHVRVGTVALRLRDQRTGSITKLQVGVVWAREEGTTPEGEDPIDWLLYTNHPIETCEDALLVIYGYSLRWRVEECHRTWKAGECNVEEMQLRSARGIESWAIVLGAVAARIERLKRLAREKGARPATIDLTAIEIQALRLIRFEGRKTPPRDPAHIAEAVSWIAEIGGYANKYSGKPPGATVIGRGLERVRFAAHVLDAQRRLEQRG